MDSAKDKTTENTETSDSKRLKILIIDIVTTPDDVIIERKIDEKGVLLTIQVNSKDMGIVIGRNGFMCNAIKTYMRAFGKARDMNIRVDFLEPDGTLRGNDSQQIEGTMTNSDSSLGGDLEGLAIN